MKRPLVDSEALSAAAVAPLLLLFFIPLRIFINNTIEFPVGLPEIGLPLLALTLLVWGALYWVGRSGFWARWVVFLPGLLVFVESAILFHLAGHRPFNGQLIDWSKLIRLAWLEALALLATVTLAFLATRLRHRNRVFHVAALFILLFQTAGLVSTTITRFDRSMLVKERPDNDTSRYFAHFARLSRKANVIEMVTDHTQGSLVYEILQANLERYKKSLTGFTLFTQTSGMFPGTYPAVPHLMTGVELNLGDHVAVDVPFTHDYIHEILDTRSVVQDLKRSGFETYGYQVTPLYCSKGYDVCIGGGTFDGTPPRLDRSQEIRASILKLGDLTLFRSLPIPLRRIVYNDEQWRLRDRHEETHSLSGTLDYFIDHISVESGAAGTYNYFHHQGGHPPIQFDEQCRFVGTRKWTKESTRAQLQCTLSQLERLVAKLKAEGVYDQTMILVMGDHGSQWPTSLTTSLTGSVVAPRVITSANPLLLVKPPQANGPLRFSNAPASLTDVPATIAAAFGLNRAPDQGRPVFELGEDELRERRYLFFRPDPGIFNAQVIAKIQPFHILGNLFNPYDWTPPILSKVENPPSRLQMGGTKTAALVQGLGTVEEGGWRWVEGRLARVYLSAPTSRGALRLALECSIPRELADQSMTVRFNGRDVVELDRPRLPEGAGWLRIDLPGDVDIKPANVIEFRLTKTFQPPEDVRQLSLRLRTVALESR